MPEAYIIDPATKKYVGIITFGNEPVSINCGNGKYVRFELIPYCGLAVVGKNGDPIKDPKGSDLFWRAVDLWQQQGQRLTEDRRCIWHEKARMITRHLGGKHYEIIGYGPTPEDIS